MKNQLHIAVLDDNNDILLMVRTVLQIEAYKITTCNVLEELEDVIAKDRPDIILCDMLISGIDGRDVCRSFKENEDRAKIPFIIFTAHPDAEESCLAAGADLFLEKPFDIDKLFETCLRAINMSKSDRRELA